MATIMCIYVAVVALLVSTAAAAAAGPSGQCAGPSRFDPIVSNSTLYGRPNRSDSVWHDDTWAHKRWGPISRLTLYKAWYYDGEWHDPGEFKGIQAWHGRYYNTHETKLLFGAKRPHVPLNCTLYRSEVIVRAELQWDHIFRFMNFTTNLGRYCSWGFPDVDNVTKAVVKAPGPNMYIAALRGYEGKPLPPSLGGFKKRYIVQLGFAWAQLNCSSGNASTAAAAAAAAARQGPPGIQATAEHPVVLPVKPLDAASQPQQPPQQANLPLLPMVRGANSSVAAITPAVSVNQSYDPTVVRTQVVGAPVPAAKPAELAAALQPAATAAAAAPPAAAAAAPSQPPAAQLLPAPAAAGVAAATAAPPLPVPAAADAATGTPVAAAPIVQQPSAATDPALPPPPPAAAAAVVPA